MSAGLVLCAGMHRSGTSLTASLLQGLGITLPGDLIGADAANPSGYFENRAIVDRQETLLRTLGYWWPTERASHGLPRSVRSLPLYREHVDWLTAHLAQLCRDRNAPIAIKDPRTSMLLGAWREAADRLGLPIRVVICLRAPRDVCWSLVWRDGPSVGMDWSRAQRLWLTHHRDLLRDLGALPAFVARYEGWLQPHLAQKQLARLAAFVDVRPQPGQLAAVLERVRPEFNHGGGEHLPAIEPGLRALHAVLSLPASPRRLWRLQAELATASLAGHQRVRRARIRLQLIALRTPWGRLRLRGALDRRLLEQQLGSASLRVFRRRFPTLPDLRPHPLISPAHLNSERQRCGLPPIRSADDLFGHLLDPDLLPLDPHPWFDCRGYQRRLGQLGAGGEHPILTYLRHAALRRPDPYVPVPYLLQLGAAAPCASLHPPPALVQRLHPGLILADPIATLGHPDTGPKAIRALEAYWQDIGDTFALWPLDDPTLPLRWLDGCPGVARLGRGAAAPAQGRSCWWLRGRWEAPLLAGLAGADAGTGRCLDDPDSLIAALCDRREGEAPLLLAVCDALLEVLLDGDCRLPPDTAVLNLAWPRPERQSAWLHLIAAAAPLLECRPTVRAYLQGLGLPAQWPQAPHPASQRTGGASPRRHLLLASDSSPAERALVASVERLDATRYSAVLRLDAQMQSLGDGPEAGRLWLEARSRDHGRWIWLNAPPSPQELGAHTVLAWCEQAGVAVTMAESGEDPPWLEALLG